MKSNAPNIVNNFLNVVTTKKRKVSPLPWMDVPEDKVSAREHQEVGLDIQEIENRPKNRKKISKMHFLVDGMTVDHVKHVFGEKCAGRTNSDLLLMLKELKSDQKRVIDWGKGELIKLMLSRARQRPLKKPNGELPSQLEDLQLIWASAANDGMENFRTTLEAMYDVTIAWAEEHPTWQLDMESFYMNTVGWEYMEDTVYISKHCQASDANGRGCVARLLTESRKRVMKTLNYLARKSHGISLRVQRTSIQIEKENEELGKKNKET